MAERDQLIRRMRLLEEMAQMEKDRVPGEVDRPEISGPEMVTDPASEALETPLIDPVGAVVGGGIGGALAGKVAGLASGIIGGTSNQPGATGANIGETVGTALGAATGPAAPVAIPALSAAGAGTGFIIEQLLMTGEVPSKGRVAAEMGMAAIPQVAETGIKAAATPLRRAVQRATAENRLPILRGTKGGQVLRQAEQMRLLKGQGRQIFQAPTEQMVDQAFDAVRASGAKVAPEPLQAFMSGRNRAERMILKREILAGDAILNRRLGTQGNRQFTQLFDTLDDIENELRRARASNRTADAIRPPRVAQSLDIGDAQNLRSVLRERIEKVSNPVTIDLLEDLKGTVDDAINATIEGSNVVGARDMYRRYIAADDLEGLFIKNSTLPTGRGNIRTLRLSSLRQTLDKAAAGQGDRSTQRLYQNLKDTPGALDRMDNMLEELKPFAKQIELTVGGGDTSGLGRDSRIAAMFRGLSEALLSDRGITLFKDVAKEQKGRITGNDMALIVNAIRREAEGLPPEQRP
ncbi:MAG: hypothetical protein ACR2PS_11810 [Pseudomonadales bacterium]